MTTRRFIDLFAGIGGFHRALTQLGMQCVYASELDPELRQLYVANFPDMRRRVYGDLREFKDKIPDHEVLCAGFPCQPFSKSGAQLGTDDETRGTLFHEILEVLKRKRPPYVILENVGNFGRHDRGRTWAIVRRRLSKLGYNVAGTEHVTPPPTSDWRDAGSPDLPESTRGKRHGSREPAGTGLISPHHFGEPHHRERFFIVASLEKLPSQPFPETSRRVVTSLTKIVQDASELSERDREETRLTPQQVECIELWNALLSNLPDEFPFPGAPIWGDEFVYDYPYYPLSPYGASLSLLRTRLGLPRASREELLALLPNYAREPRDSFRHWKVSFIRKNRDWWRSARPYAPPAWLDRLQKLPPSLRKLEWNAKGEDRDIWRYVLQFRPSGLRVKRYTSSPALVAMTATQIPILGPERRSLTRVEGLRLQGFPDDHRLPPFRTSAFKALGNAVHVTVVKAIAERLLGTVPQSRSDLMSCG